MQISINIEKRHLFLILAVIVLMAGVVVIAGGNYNNPAVLGHSPSEIDWSQPIANVLKIGVAESGSGNKVIAFVRDVGDASNAGKIAYKPTWDTDALTITGAGAAANVKIRDNLEIVSSLKTPSLCLSGVCKTSWPTTTWPDGNYCIIQAQNKACPTGFTATNPEGVSGAIYGGTRSITGPVEQRAKGSDGDYASLEWAFCCK